MSSDLDPLTILSNAAEHASSARDVADLERILASATQRLGFDTFNLAVNKASSRLFMIEPTLTSWAREDLLAYDHDYWFERDPLLSYASTENAPLNWSTDDFKSWGHHEYHEYIHSSGIKGGLTVPLPGGGSGLSAMTLLKFSDNTADAGAARASLVLASLLSARAIALGAAKRMNDDPIRLKQLSGTQTEILKWVALGKSNIEISIILDLKKRTIDYHVSQILDKLVVSNRAEAATIYIAR